MASYQSLTYLLQTRDPVHIGTGGYRLGRVDNSIIREPGTEVPKIPGTSLHGAIRSYAARIYENPDAAGQDHRKVTQPAEDPVCYTFGYIAGKKGGAEHEVTSYAGVANVFDARVLLFPVASAEGPLWVTTLRRLQAAGATVANVPAEWTKETVLTTGDHGDRVNLGWLALAVGTKVTIDWPEPWLKDALGLPAITERIVLVHDDLFSQVVNSNLEVRTSVSIDPETGAAASGALFTYEALPRATWLTMDLVIDDYREKFPVQKETLVSNEPLPGSGWNAPRDVVESGMSLIGWLGVGGMGTRGFGRLSLSGDAIVHAAPGGEGSDVR